MAYSIYGKNWTLEGKLENNVLKLELVADDGERESVYAKNLTNVDGCPEWDYAGDGLFWSETRWEDGDKVPTADATKITPEEWARKTAIEAVDALIEQECNIPGSADCPERGGRGTSVLHCPYRKSKNRQRRNGWGRSASRTGSS